MITDEKLSEEQLYKLLKNIGTGSQNISQSGVLEYNMKGIGPSTELNNQTTDSNTPDYKTIDYKFGEYLVKIILSQDNKFFGIKEIIENKDFVVINRRKTSKKYIDVDRFYKE